LFVDKTLLELGVWSKCSVLSIDPGRCYNQCFRGVPLHRNSAWSILMVLWLHLSYISPTSFLPQLLLYCIALRSIYGYRHPD